jgi:Domain of unknown function (DUF4436)
VTPWHSPRHRHGWILVLVLAVVTGSAGFGIVESLRSYSQETTQSSSSSSSVDCEGKQSPSNVQITATIIAVDTEALTATMRLDFLPNGGLANQNRSSNQHYVLKQPLTLTTTGLLAQPPGASSSGATSESPESQGFPNYSASSSSFVFFKGDFMQTLDVAIPLAPGTIENPSAATSTARYPWDTYTNDSFFSFQVRRGIGTSGGYVPSCVYLGYSVGGWSINEVNYIGNSWDVSFARSHPIKFYCYFVIALMWALALGGVAMATIMMMRKKEAIDTAAFAYLAALLFAFPLIRQTLPGNPGPGSLIDIVAYYWTEVIVAATLVVLLIRWISMHALPVHKDPPDRTERTGGAV